MNTYIIVMHDKSFYFVGPFASAGAASRWVDAGHNGICNNPLWQTISLGAEQLAVPPRVYAPVQLEKVKKVTP